MKTFQTGRWPQKLVVAAVATMIGAALLEIVADAMKHPDPGTVAARAQFLATERERALELRMLQQQRQLATVPPAKGI